MARQTVPLNASKIMNARPQETDYTLSDGNGLYLLVKKTGTKLWRFNYYDITKKRKLISLGAYPEVSLADARIKRDELRGLVAQGVDPQDYLFKQKEQAVFDRVHTVLAVAEGWKAVKETKVTEKTMHDQWAKLEKYLFPHIGHLPISELTAPLVNVKLKHLADRRIYETLKKIIRGLNEIMTYAVNSGVIKYNPLVDLAKLYPSGDAPTHFPSIHPKKLPALMADVNRSRMSLQTRCLFEWQMLTVVRPAEAAGTRWDEIDFENLMWNIPKERMKGVKNKKRPHSVPLSKQAVEVLNIMRPLSGHSVFVFPKNGNIKESMGSETVNKALVKMGYQGILCSHGIRSIASTAMYEEEFNEEIVESLLAHVKGDKVRTAYDRSRYERQRREYLSWWGDFVERAAVGSALLSSGNRFPLGNPSV
ncbi:Integrase [Pasteurella testudinis DSM 23072]|uniref:Integrase n=1 Tax=Pasteurella testudinis DSM 23072 TaxID=1122938 RepID=A0A1W1UKB1_9PAST|nr:integrase arm-type DNA-binding domain-containing protein [Pasteurella testudinis]SMB81536.1 Integrase [Pasteurella testudinis DSM 23072]SUB51443.1 prophage integrase [Pasteurella testudinis]